ncbi:hypothetical protein MKW94_018313 [Papaver nudicaule]|uniref:Protein kinase domain-containing protein n=1 Tax=Papaver nudicaule TaxID=74823 RepID=A0AA41VZM6_PAPNU|nr:hypothetical protein [Papaver nudicaule]
MAFSSSPYSPLLNYSYTNSNNKEKKNWSNHCNQDKYTSTPQRGRGAKPKTQFSCSGFAPVCRCFSSSRWSTLFFSSFIFLSFSSSYFLTFCAASNPIPTPHSNTNIITSSINISPSPSPSTPTIKAVEGIHQQGKGRKHIITNSNNENHNRGHQKRRRTLIITLSVFVPIVACLFLTMACLTFLNLKRRSKRVEDVQDHQPGTPSSTCSTSSYGSSSSGSSSSQPKKMNHHKVKNNKMFANNPAAGSSSVPRRFTWEEVEGLTMNFSSRVIGEGGFSTLYLSHFSDSVLGALKIHGGNSERLNRMFKQELEVLLHIRHRNIVNLLGYCDEREQGALVFEYIPNGTLYDKLHHGNDDVEKEVLSWKSRMSIAFQLAQAIEYLHEECKPQIVHGDIKSSNILLDDQLNPKLCDFGFSKMGFSSTIIKSSMNPIMGSPGYMDPLYLRTGIASKKNDVYSFGVIILELITGIEAFCSEKEQLLTSIAGPIIRDANKVAEMMDPRLSVGAGDMVQEEAKIMATISAQCLRQQSSLRPSMSEILHTMRDKISFEVLDR